MSNLTASNYFTDDSYLHYTQLSTYLKSKELYKLRYIDKLPDFQFKKTDAVILGTIVDEILTEGKTQYAPKVLKRDDEELFEKQKEHPELIATPAVWEKAMAIIEQLPKHPIYQYLKDNAEWQKIVEMKWQGQKYAGKLDAVTNDGLFDIKVTNQLSAKKWYWHLQDFNYDLQAYMYWLMTGKTKPFYHLVMWLEDGLLKVKLYRLDSSIMCNGETKFYQAIEGIKSGDFEPELCSMESAVMLGRQPVEDKDNSEEEEF